MKSHCTGAGRLGTGNHRMIESVWKCAGTKKTGYCNSDLVDLTCSASFHYPAVQVIEIGDRHVILDLGTVFDQIRDVALPPTPTRSIHAKWRFDPDGVETDSELSNLITEEINSEIIRTIFE